jgi:hypothetical protein
VFPLWRRPGASAQAAVVRRSLTLPSPLLSSAWRWLTPRTTALLDVSLGRYVACKDMGADAARMVRDGTIELIPDFHKHEWYRWMGTRSRSLPPLSPSYLTLCLAWFSLCCRERGGLVRVATAVVGTPRAGLQGRRRRRDARRHRGQRRPGYTLLRLCWILRARTNPHACSATAEDWQNERWVIARNQEEALEKAKKLYPEISAPKLEQVHWPRMRTRTRTRTRHHARRAVLG